MRHADVDRRQPEAGPELIPARARLLQEVDLLLGKVQRRLDQQAQIHDALAQQVAGFHAALPPSPPSFGAPATAQRWLLDALDTLAAKAFAHTASYDTAIANDIVMPKLPRKRPGMPDTKAMGRKTAMSDRVVAMTARPISAVPSRAAWS